MERVVLSYVIFNFLFVFLWTGTNCQNCFRMEEEKRNTTWYNVTMVNALGHIQDKEPKRKLERPKDLDLNVLTSGYRLTWKPPSGYKMTFVKYFMLEVVQEYTNHSVPMRGTQYTLLGPFDIVGCKVRRVFSYDCIQLHPNTERATFKMWSLGNYKQQDGTPVYWKGPLNVASLSWSRKDYDRHQANLIPDPCVHEARILKVTLLAIDGTTLASEVFVSNHQKQIKIEFVLNGNDVTIESWKSITDISKNTTRFKQTFPVSPGQYVLKARKVCTGEEDSGTYLSSKSVSIGQDQTVVLPSHNILPEQLATYIEVAVQNGGKRIKDDEFLPYPLPNDSSNLNESADDKSKLAAWPENVVSAYPIRWTVGMLNVILLSVVGGLFIFVTMLIVTIQCGRKTKKAYEMPTVKTKLCKRVTNENGPIAVIYVNDTDQHRRRVYNLCVALKREGIQALPIDEHTRNKEMFENWIAEGESISNTYQNFVVVLSDGLMNACSSAPGCDQINKQPTPSSGHYKLPLVILNSIKSRVLRYDTKNVRTVCFKSYTDSSGGIPKDAYSDFNASHRSVITSDTVTLTVKDNLIVRNKAFTKFVLPYRLTDRSPICVWDMVVCI